MSRSRYRTAAALLCAAAVVRVVAALAGGSRPAERAAAPPPARAEAPALAERAPPPGDAAPAEPDGVEALLAPLRADPANAALHDALVAARAREAVPDLLRLLDTDPPRKELLVRTIAALGGAEAWEGLVARLGDESLRTAIEVALGKHAPPEVIDRLKRELLPAPEPFARASVVRILGLTADRRHGADVRALVDSETEPDVRHAAIGALGRLGDPASAEALIGLARLGGREARAAYFALLDLRDADALGSVAARWPELDGPMRLALLCAGTDADPAAARPLLACAKEALHDGDEQVRLRSLDLLARLGDDAVEPLLDHALRGASRKEAERTLAALAGLNTPRAAEAGLRALEALPPRSQERHRAAFLATLSR